MPDGPPRTEHPPVAAVHLGLGAFFRAHQAWYTEDTGAGIHAFTGRSPAAARELAAQGCVYTLIDRGPQADRAEIVQSVVGADDGADRDAWLRAIGDPAVGVLTLTVTEAGYHLRADGAPAADDPALAADRASLDSGGPARTAPGQIVDALRLRRTIDAPLAVVPCDNLPGNGALTGRAVLQLAESVDAGLAEWIAMRVSFVSTVVDRITPATTPDDVRVARSLTGFADRAPVVTEPQASWVLAGAFPAGRPAWEQRGARFVDDVGPFERQKLWLLNAAHSLLAYRGVVAGIPTVALAMADRRTAAAVEALWAEAAPVTGLGGAEIAGYLDELRQRFANARIEHRLAQIAKGGVQKLPVRVLDAIRARRAAHLSDGAALAGVIGAWIAYLTRTDEGAADPAGGPIRAAREVDRPRAALALLAPDLADDGDLRAAIAAGVP